MLLLTWILFAGVQANVLIIENSVNVTTERINNEFFINDLRKDSNDIIEEPNNVISTEYGNVRGFQRNSGIWQYFDIPYGAFDIDNPFQPPTSPEPWTNTHQVNEHKSLCPQILQNSGTYSGNEDCLTLSIFTPSSPNNSDVLFHVHDGLFAYGSGDPNTYGPEYLVPKGIILVLPNYRLGSLGFLCLQNETAPGNAGLKDLTLALNWTRSNIAAFGGNASNIVVSGSGSAAALVEYLLLSEKSKVFISKAITESGSVLSHWAFDRFPLETAATLDEKLANRNGKEEDTQEYQNIFKNISLEVLVEVSNGIKFKPCVEQSEFGIITATPAVLLRNTNLNITYMSGFAKHAGLNRALQHDEKSISELNDNYTLLLPDDLEFSSYETMLKIGNQVKMQYFGQDDITMDTIEKLSLCYTDNEFLGPGLRGVRSLVESGVDVYYYEFSCVNTQYTINKCGQGQSLNYVFSKETLFEQDTEDYLMMTLMTTLWSNFIRNGVPVLGDIEWSKLDAANIDKETWLSIGQEVEIKKGLHRDRLKLWDEIYKNYFFDRSLSGELKPSVSTICASVVLIINFHKNLIT